MMKKLFYLSSFIFVFISLFLVTLSLNQVSASECDGNSDCTWVEWGPNYCCQSNCSVCNKETTHSGICSYGHCYEIGPTWTTVAHVDSCSGCCCSGGSCVDCPTCTPGETQSCSVGICPGTKTCLSNRTWGSCQKDDSGCPYICTSCSGNSCVTGGQSASPCEGCSGDADCIPAGCTDPVPCSQLCTNWQTANCNEPCGFYGGIQDRDCDSQPDPECPGCNETRCVDCACGTGVPACAAFQPTCAVVVEPTTSQALSLTNPSFELGNSTGWNPFSNGEVHSKYVHPGSGNYGAGSEGEGGPYEQTINAPQTSLYRVQSWGGASCYRWQECEWGCASTRAHINVDGYESFTISEGSKQANGTIIWNELNRIFPPKDGSLRVSLYSTEDVDDPACGYAGMWSAHDDLRITKINSAQTTESDLVSIRIAAQGQGGITQFKVKNSATGQWGGWNTWSPGADGTVLSGTYLAPEVNTVEVNALDYYGQVASCTNTVTFEQKDPWFQTQDGDVHAQGSISSKIPATAAEKYFSLNGSGGYPGVVSYNGSSADFTPAGSVSLDPPFGWLAKTNFSKKSYNYFYQLLGLPTLETPPPEIKNEDLPSGDGIKAYSDNIQTGNTWQIGTRKIVILTSGKFLIKHRIIIDSGGSLVVVAQQGIGVSKNLIATGEPQNYLGGIFITDGIFYSSVEENFNLTSVPSEKVLVVQGGVIAGQVNLTRDLEDNSTTPAETFRYDPSLFMNIHPDLWRSSFTWEELAP